MKNITDSLLFLSENFTLKEIQKFEINKAVKEYIEKENLTKSVKITYFPENIEINKNKNMFERILKNLIENALKYGCDKKVFIKIEKNNITFSNKIKESIKKEKLDKIFEIFYQVDSKNNN
jgi:signal transduction histidine kinase